MQLWCSSMCLMHIPNLHVSATIVLCPDAKDILTTSDTDDSTAYLLTRFSKLISNHGHQEILPVTVSHTLLQPQYPLSTLLVLLILPHWSDAFPEEVIVRDCGKSRRVLEMGVHSPEILRGGHLAHGPGGLFVVGVLGCGWPVPDDPAVFQGP